MGVAMLMLGSPAAFADEAPNLLTDSFQVALGTFVITSEPTVQLKGDTGAGDRVDFDEALGGVDDDARAQALCFAAERLIRHVEEAPEERVIEQRVQLHLDVTFAGDIDHRRRHVLQHRRETG